jgi:hypothetical protein
VLAIIAAAGCNRPADGLRHDDENNSAMTREDVRQHELTSFARVEGLQITYPPEQAALL